MAEETVETTSDATQRKNEIIISLLFARSFYALFSLSLSFSLFLSLSLSLSLSLFAPRFSFRPSRSRGLSFAQKARREGIE
jgi:hypothetical protein